MLEKRRLHRRAITLVGIGLLSTALLAPVAVSAAYAAGNWGNTDYHSGIGYASVSYTDAREKLDRTSSWDQCYSGPNHKVEVFGTHWNWDPQWVGSTAYYFGPGASGYLVNQVKENRYERALLWFSEPTYSGTINGAWSPDSI